MSSPPRNLVNLKDASKGYAARTVLDGVTLGVSAGDRVGIVGRNGGGKSTLLRLVAGVEEPDGGAGPRAGGPPPAPPGPGGHLGAGKALGGARRGGRAH